MKIGGENKKQVIAMAVLLLVAATVVIYDFSGSGTSSAAPPTPSAARTRDAQRTRPGAQQVAQSELDPTLRLDVLEASRKVKYEAGGRNIFRMEEPPPPKPIASVRATPPPFPTPTPTPPPPPIPLKFYGFANKPGEAKKIFLSEGDPQSSTVFIAKQGDIVNRRYRVVQISISSVQIEDVLYNNKQTIPLTAR